MVANVAGEVGILNYESIQAGKITLKVSTLQQCLLFSTYVIMVSFNIHPGIPEVLRHSVKLGSLPLYISLIDRLDLAGMMPSPTQ
jgi:hypothetical protein